MSTHELKKKTPAPQKGPITIKLSEPIEWGSEAITEITLQRPRAKHIKNISTKDVKIADMLAIASKLSGVSASALDELSMDDMHKVVEAVGELL